MARIAARVVGAEMSCWMPVGWEMVGAWEGAASAVG
jgi:hypothetical protein